MKSLSNLRVFCEYVVRKFNEPGVVSEERLAEEFRTVYLKGLPLDLRTLRAVATSCGIKLNELEQMPDNMRGFHEVYGDNKNIYFKKDDTLSGIENTILHEIREMMETLFAEVCQGYEPLRTSARHIAANKFASAVLLPEESFRNKVYETGLDIITLSKFYAKSCSQVLLRMGEVLQGRLFIYAALYEPDAENQWRVTYWTGCCNEIDPEANIYGSNTFFPRKGRIAEPGSLVEMTIKKANSHFAERITILDETEDEGLIALASPLIASQRATKVALVVLLSRNKDLLEPQIQRFRPALVSNFHGHL